MKKLNFKNFRDDESGSITIFLILMFLIMVVGSGMAVDFMRYESERAALQDALDRGVLAAASFDQQADPEDVVESYLRSNSLGDKGATLIIDSDISLNSRRVTIDANYNINTIFLKIAGITTMTVHGHSSAMTARNEIELSLILDVTGSMGGSKIQNLRDAANEFVDLMITPENQGRSAMSVIPFNTQVVVSADVVAQYNINTWHDYSTCITLDPDGFTSTEMDVMDSYEQDVHMRTSYYSGRPWCPVYGSSEYNSNVALFLSDTPSDLHAKIDGLRAKGYTASWAGMRWGVNFLDPGTQPVVEALTQIAKPLVQEVDEWGNLVFDGGGAPVMLPQTYVVNPAFSNRPEAYDDEETLKFIVLMTDGDNTQHSQMNPNTYNHEGTASFRSQENADYWDDNTVPRTGWRMNGSQTVTGGEGDRRLDLICTAAKDAGITVYTIGFQVSEGSRAYRAMESCASSAAKFYHVSGLELAVAFRQIASSIEKLKLID